VTQAQAVAAQASAQEQQVRERAARFGSMDLGPLARPRGTAVDRSRSGVGAQAQGPDPRDQRFDAICDKVLAELRSSPEVVKEIFRKPEETVAALRATCRDLTRREREVRRFLVPEEDARLERERAALVGRVSAETDEVTRLRLASALAALDQQRQQRVDLGRSAARFDAEHTRIFYTLESLYTQVVRMRSADAGSGLNCANQRSTFVLTAPPSFPKKKIASSAGSESPGAVGTRWVARRIAELLASTGQDAGDFQVRPPA